MSMIGNAVAAVLPQGHRYEGVIDTIGCENTCALVKLAQPVDGKSYATIDDLTKKPVGFKLEKGRAVRIDNLEVHGPTLHIAGVL